MSSDRCSAGSPPATAVGVKSVIHPDSSAVAIPRHSPSWTHDQQRMTQTADVALPIAIAVIGFGGSVVVAFAALAGIWITMKNERGREEDRREWAHQRWRSELKLESYADLIRAADDFRKAAIDLRNADPSHQLELARFFEEQCHLLDR